MTGIVAAPAAAQMGAFGPGGPAADHLPGLQDGWLKTFGSSQGLPDFATECAAAGYGLVAMGGEYRGELLDENGVTVALSSSSFGSTGPAGFVAAAEEDGSNAWSWGMVGRSQFGHGSAHTKAVAFGDPETHPTATLFAAGALQNRVDFDPQGAGLVKSATGNTKDCFIASFNVAGDNVNWVTTFRTVAPGNVNDEIFGVDASGRFDFEGAELFEGVNWDLMEDPPTGTPPVGKDSLGEVPISVLAVCGGFRESMELRDPPVFGGPRATAVGGEDGFVVLLHPNSGTYLAHATFGGTGDDRAFAVTFGPDPAYPTALGGDLMPPVIYVSGFFSGTATFGGLPPVTSAGNRDGFIARLRMTKPGSDIVLTWDRLYTFGADHNDVARALSTEGIIRQIPGPSGGNAFGRVAFTGWTGGGSSEGRELITGALIDYKNPSRAGLPSIRDLGVDWQHELTDNDDTDDAGLGVAWDRFSRVVVTGQFGVQRPPSSSTTTATASFDPAGGDSKTTWGGWDMFLARYSSTGSYLDAAFYGYTYNDWGGSVLVDRETEQVWVSGVFGDPDAPATHNVGFGTALPAYSRGAADMFWLSLETPPLESLDGMVSIVLDSSGSMLPTEFDNVKASLATLFREGPFTIRRTGRLAFNVVLFGDNNAVEAVPWTIIDPVAVEAFASAIEDMEPLGGGTNVWDGINFALTAFQASDLLSLTDEEDRHMLVIGDGTDGPQPPALLAMVQGLGWPAEVAGVPIDGVLPPPPPPPPVATWFETEVISLSQATPSKQILYQAIATTNPLDPDHFEYQARKALKELTCCRGDFNGDGQHDFWTDYPVFLDLYTWEHPAADLDCDADWTVADFLLFQDYLLEDCPCGP